MSSFLLHTTLLGLPSLAEGGHVPGPRGEVVWAEMPDLKITQDEQRPRGMSDDQWRTQSSLRGLAKALPQLSQLQQPAVAFDLCCHGHDCLQPILRVGTTNYTPAIIAHLMRNDMVALVALGRFPTDMGKAGRYMAAPTPAEAVEDVACGVFLHCGAPQCKQDAEGARVHMMRASGAAHVASCETCHKTGVPLEQCSRCKVPVYCSPACQRVHWKQGGHKAVCKPRVW